MKVMILKTQTTDIAEEVAHMLVRSTDAKILEGADLEVDGTVIKIESECEYFDYIRDRAHQIYEMGLGLTAAIMGFPDLAEIMRSVLGKDDEVLK